MCARARAPVCARWPVVHVCARVAYRRLVAYSSNEATAVAACIVSLSYAITIPRREKKEREKKNYKNTLLLRGRGEEEEKKVGSVRCAHGHLFSFDFPRAEWTGPVHVETDSRPGGESFEASGSVF